MDLTHTFTVPTPVDETWAHFNDIASVAECFPGATVTSVEGDTFKGSCKVKLGPIALVYNGSGTFVEKDEAAHRFVVEAKGKDKRGNGTAGANVTVSMADVVRIHRRGGRHRPLRHRQACAVRPWRDAGRLGQAPRPVRRLPRDPARRSGHRALRRVRPRRPGRRVDHGSRGSATPAGAPARGGRAGGWSATPRRTPEAPAKDDAIDLGATVLPVLVKTYWKQGLGVLVVVALVIWWIARG